MLHPFPTPRVWTIVWLAVLVAIPALLPGTATAQDTTAPAGPSPQLLTDASWHGRPIQRPLPRRSGITDRPASLRPGTGYHRPGGSRRVRTLQRKLSRLGYRPGPSDGLYGPRTQAAVQAFQHKHGLPRTGTAGTDTLRILRQRTTPRTTSPATSGAPSTAATPPRPSPARPATPAPAADTGTGPPLLAVLLLVALAIPLITLTALLLGRRRMLAAQQPARAPRALPPAPEPEPPFTLQPIAQQTPRITVTAHPRHHGPPHERRAALRGRILAMRADGMSLQQIADQLTAEGEPTLGGGRYWQPWSVRAATRPFTPAPRPPASSRKEVR